MIIDQKLNFKKIQIANEFAYPNYFYAVSLASSVLLYAQINLKFAANLKEKIKILPIMYKDIICPEIEAETMILFPESEETAEKRVDWLINQLAEKSIMQSEEAAMLLQSWANSSANLQRQVIIGIVGLAIPGVTLGRISRRKTMSVVIREDLATEKIAALTKTISQTSLDVFKIHLDLAGENIRQLEPDVADWFFGEREILFYKAKGREMESIKKTLVELGVPHSERNWCEKMAVLAVSPIANTKFAMMNWEIDPLMD